MTRKLSKGRTQLDQMARMGMEGEHDDQLWWQQTMFFLLAHKRPRELLLPPATKFLFFQVWKPDFH